MPRGGPQAAISLERGYPHPQQRYRANVLRNFEPPDNLRLAAGSFQTGTDTRAPLSPFVILEPERRTACDVRTGEGRAPISLNVLDHKVRSIEVIHLRSLFGIVHRIGHIAHQR